MEGMDGWGGEGVGEGGVGGEEVWGGARVSLVWWAPRAHRGPLPLRQPFTHGVSKSKLTRVIPPLAICLREFTHVTPFIRTPSRSPPMQANLFSSLDPALGVKSLTLQQMQSAEAVLPPFPPQPATRAPNPPSPPTSALDFAGHCDLVSHTFSPHCVSLSHCPSL